MVDVWEPILSPIKVSIISDFDGWFNLNENNRAHLTSWEELKNKHDVSYKSTFKTISTG